jgi:hypothetical protein
MKAKTRAQSEMPALPIPVVSELVLASTRVAVKDHAVTHTQIRELAYMLQEHGRVDGNDLQDWLEAETILRERGKLEASTSISSARK